jgi:hypothetical protein
LSQLAFLEDVYVVVERAPQGDLVAQERAALVTAHLHARGSITLDEVRALTGLTYSGAWYLMTKIARVIPCYYDAPTRAWKLAG